MPFPYDPENYQNQLENKALKLKGLFQDWETPELEVFDSPKSHYRMRAEFRVWHEDERSFLAMFKKEDPRTPVCVKDFPIASELINELMDKVLKAIHEDPELRFKLFQVEFLTTKAGDALITLIYHRQLNETWEERGRHWQATWGVPVIGRARKQRLVLDRDYVNEQLEINGKSYQFRQYENGFTQPNARVCEKMVSWAVNHTRNSQQADLMEMYCGNGNFSIPMAENFRRALGTEISRTSVKCANENIELNKRENLKIARMASEDLSKAWLHNEPNRRFNEFGISEYDFDTVLVDPPRAGLDGDSVELLKHFRKIVYVSCNPNTLIENLESLKNEYRITAFAFFDQFPYTDHMEAGVVLERL
ncbi:tRNA (uridine(54)-C5)-methyltransferase TrmA [Reinekea marinisedimentorum]|uniref:tRNA/tmRNA (uracil-C(5))-methyltransferase n=1 Tax=Reinekea marinisedimentorum TaxID=230495 RepID=A0A4R3IBE3_9GAMM|nr:tRNA (uridine(54)-C5)-methyltransferase TrmA [Reinekea marinisedimentorum]TCS42591.1 tRNA (uracil-5-)-methyltransferase [Reinekea marinisedimentorum]